jgi:hypothetical protein
MKYNRGQLVSSVPLLAVTIELLGSQDRGQARQTPDVDELISVSPSLYLFYQCSVHSSHHCFVNEHW